MNWNKAAWIALLLTTVLLAACGGGAGQAAEGTGAAKAQPAAQKAEEMTPADLGDTIGAVYADAIEAVTKETSSHPEPSVLRPKLEKMREDYIARLVELGRAREALGAADRATVDSRIRMSMSMIPMSTFSAYADGQSQYFSSDKELANLIASFNVITQYASFDLLKKQAPKEAERLGIQ